MIDVIGGFPENVLAVRAKGRVTAKDYEQVLIPAIAAALKHHERIRVYYELGDEFEGIDAGAMFEDMKVGLAKLPHWEKIALVTDVGWIRQAASVFTFLVHGQARVFPASDVQAAKAWIVA